MLQTEFSHDTFGMLSFLRLVGLRIDGRMLKFLGMNRGTIGSAMLPMVRWIERLGVL